MTVCGGGRGQNKLDCMLRASPREERPRPIRRLRVVISLSVQGDGPLNGQTSQSLPSFPWTLSSGLPQPFTPVIRLHVSSSVIASSLLSFDFKHPDP